MFRGLVFAGLLALAPSFAWAQQPCSTDARHVVDELYRHMLERTADAGSQGWVDRLNQGMTVRELVRQIDAAGDPGGVGRPLTGLAPTRRLSG